MVEYSVISTEVTNLAMNRKPDSDYDFVIVTKNERYMRVVSIRELLL